MQDAFAYCEALVRAADKDRFIATLFAPAEKRGALFALCAFNIEIARVRDAVRDPIAGEIRLQWWSEALAGAGRGDVEANPVAAALLATVARHALPDAELQRMLDARRFELYDEPMATLADLQSYADGVSTSLIRLAIRILRADDDPHVDGLAVTAGRAHAIAALMNALPQTAARGQVSIPLEILQRHGAGPRDALAGPATPPLRAALAELRLLARHDLAQGRALIGATPPSVVPALLPVAMVGPTLDRMERPGYDPFIVVAIPQWRRQWLIWRAARRPARIFT
jgi:15-cis-phytoene synthase